MDVFDCSNLISFLFDLGVRGAVSSLISSYVAECGSPLDKKAAELQTLYYRFLLDPSSKIVRGTAFQNIGPFIATFKDVAQIDVRITNFFVNTTIKTNNKDVC